MEKYRVIRARLAYAYGENRAGVLSGVDFDDITTDDCGLEIDLFFLLLMNISNAIAAVFPMSAIHD